MSEWQASRMSRQHGGHWYWHIGGATLSLRPAGCWLAWDKRLGPAQRATRLRLHRIDWRIHGGKYQFICSCMPLPPESLASAYTSTCRSMCLLHYLHECKAIDNPRMSFFRFLCARIFGLACVRTAHTSACMRTIKQTGNTCQKTVLHYKILALMQTVHSPARTLSLIQCLYEISVAPNSGVVRSHCARMVVFGNSDLSSLMIATASSKNWMWSCLYRRQPEQRVLHH